MQRIAGMKKPKTLKQLAHVTKKRSPIKGSRPATGSSHVTSTKYDPDLGHLEVKFQNGRSYRYSGVSKETASGIESADSVGRYLHANVIGKHSVEKI
jgi:hypothetical protein